MTELKTKTEALINLHIAEYNMLTDRCTYYMIFQIVILTAVIATFGLAELLIAGIVSISDQSQLIKEVVFPVRINEVLVGDITYTLLKSGDWGYLVVWMDLFSRKVTGWQLLGHMREELVIQVFKKAWSNRSAAEA